MGPVRFRNRRPARRLVILGAVALALALAAGNGAATDSPSASKRKPAQPAGGASPTGKSGSRGQAATPAAKAGPASQPAAPQAPLPGTAEMTQLAFLSGKWLGKIDSYPIKMDISIDGAIEKPGQTMKFNIHAAPAPGVNIGIDGDYSSFVSYSRRYGAIRAVLTDAQGRGVEMVGEPVPQSKEWLFNSTSEGAPFPFKVRLTPVTPDQIVVNYSSGGRLPLTYEVTFNRVAS